MTKSCSKSENHAKPAGIRLARIRISRKPTWMIRDVREANARLRNALVTIFGSEQEQLMSEALNSHSTIKLNSGTKMPVLGLGVWKVSDGQEVKSVVTSALGTGYRLIDTAKVYGNEVGVGEAIRESTIPREQIFVTTKLWNADQGYAPALRAVDESLQKLGLDYVDLYLIHWPFSADHRILKRFTGNKRQETWRAMEEILHSGKARAIGVANYTIKHLQEMKGYATVLPAVDQVEFHPFLYQKEIWDFCQQQGIALEAYSPLARGEKLGDARISAVARKYHKSNAQIMIRWSLQHRNIVIPKSVHPERIKENFTVFDFSLDPSDMLALDALNENLHITWDPSNVP